MIRRRPRSGPLTDRPYTKPGMLKANWALTRPKRPAYYYSTWYISAPLKTTSVRLQIGDNVAQGGDGVRTSTLLGWLRSRMASTDRIGHQSQHVGENDGSERHLRTSLPFFTRYILCPQFTCDLLYLRTDHCLLC